VIADEARADIMIRLVGDPAATKAALFRAAEGRAELREVIEIPAVRLGAVDGIPTTVVAYTTDIPAFGGEWGEPLLIGPGTIHVAHTLEERVPKTQLLEAVELYQRIVKDLCKRESK
jgi:acetylornithine deacetylase